MNIKEQILYDELVRESAQRYKQYIEELVEAEKRRKNLRKLSKDKKLMEELGKTVNFEKAK